LRVAKRLVVLDVRGAGGGDGRQGFVDQAISLAEGTGSCYCGGRLKNRREEVIAFGGFDFGFRFRFLHAARHLVSRAT